MNEKLKPCPCGLTPSHLNITGTDAKWKYVSGACCDEWNIEFRTFYYKDGSPELMEVAVNAWNSAKHPAKVVKIEWPEKKTWDCDKAMSINMGSDNYKVGYNQAIKDCKEAYKKAIDGK